jgi:chorismate-pyruvate lyase
VASSTLIALAVAAVVTPQPRLADFEAVLARHDSATQALEEWCAANRIADPPQIRARKLGATSNDPPRRMRRRLGLSAEEPFALRHVRLSCGGAVLSVAWNWYVPSRLTPAMNEALQTTDAPFGKVVAPLGFRREPLATVTGRAENCPQGTISTHRARLVLPDGKPMAYLIECYTAANLRSGSR